MKSDLFNVYPTDKLVNNKRGNYPYGETNGEIYKSDNGFSKLGACSFPGYSGTVFEPNDQYKGDFHRSYFYIATCYEDVFPQFGGEMTAGNSYPGYERLGNRSFVEMAQKRQRRFERDQPERSRPKETTQP